jgi:hypothetical protein
LKHISFDLDTAEKMFDKACWSDPQRANVSGILCDLTTKSFGELGFDEDSGRLYYELVNMKAEARVLLRYKDLKYRAVLDIRCCHPTFLSSLIFSPYTLHYGPDKTDKPQVLEEEHRKWVDFFCNPDKDPKEGIQKLCRFADVETAKSAMNESLNGSKRYPKYLEWMKTEFPILFSQWQKTEVKKTGEAIAKNFEHPLILHQGLYDQANLLGVKIMPEHDGVGVFAKEDDKELPMKLEALAKYLQSYSKKLFGVPVVVKTKYVFDWWDTDLFLEMQHKRSELDKEYAKLRPTLTRLQRQYFPKRHPDVGKAYGEAREKEKVLLTRYRPVIDYWVEYEKNVNAKKQNHSACV